MLHGQHSAVVAGSALYCGGWRHGEHEQCSLLPRAGHNVSAIDHAIDAHAGPPFDVVCMLFWYVQDMVCVFTSAVARVSVISTATACASAWSYPSLLSKARSGHHFGHAQVCWPVFPLTFAHAAQLSDTS